MKFSAAIILIVLLCAVAIFSSGCAKPGTVVGVADTNAERQDRMKEVKNIGWRQLVDDWDTFWLQDKDVRLSEYPVR